MVLIGRGFEFQLHLKLDGKVGPLDGRKTNENNKNSQINQVTPKNYFKKIHNAFVSRNFY